MMGRSSTLNTFFRPIALQCSLRVTEIFEAMHKDSTLPESTSGKRRHSSDECVSAQYLHLGDRVDDGKPDGLVSRQVLLLREEETAKDFVGCTGSRAGDLCWLSGHLQFELQ